MKKVMAAISLMFMVMLVNSSSAVSAIEVDISSGSSYAVEDDSGGSSSFSIELLDGSAGGSFSVEPGPDSGGAGSFMIEWLSGSAGSLYRFSQWEYLFH